ncbi:hypothetical protein D3C72_2281100 [compost metagenome]
MAQFDPVALMVAPQRQHHVRHHHHQSGALGNLLIETAQYAQQRNGDQSPADAEQAAKGPQGRTENQVHQKLEHSVSLP